MDILTHAQFLRAHSVLSTALKELGGTEKEAAAGFLEITKAMLNEPDAQRQRAAVQGLAGHPNELVAKAATSAMSYTEELYGDGPLRAMADAWVASLPEQSVLDVIAKFATVLPAGTSRVMMATGEIANLTAESGLKAVRRPGLNPGDIEMTKAAGIFVTTKEFGMTGGPALTQLLDRELGASVNRAVNRTVVEHFMDSNAITVPSTNDALGDLRAGLQAAGPSMGYVVIADAGVVADLACRAEAGPNFGVRGGEFKPGVWVCAIDDDSQPMLIIPASRVALFDGGLEVRPAGHASLEMSDSPTGDGTLVSLFQTGSVAVLAERQWHIGGDAQVCIVEGS